MHYIRFNASGCIKASRSTDVFLAIALIISGRPRVPIGLFAQKGLYSAKSKSNTSLSAEEKVQAESIRFFPHFFRLASSLKQWKLTKSAHACFPRCAILDLRLYRFRSISVRSQLWSVKFASPFYRGLVTGVFLCMRFRRFSGST